MNTTTIGMHIRLNSFGVSSARVVRVYADGTEPVEPYAEVSVSTGTEGRLTLFCEDAPFLRSLAETLKGVAEELETVRAARVDSPASVPVSAAAANDG